MKTTLSTLFKNALRLSKHLRWTFLMTLLGLLLSSNSLSAQQVLAQYLAEGLENNLVLKEKNTSLDQSLLALKDAKSYFLPTMDFGGSYTLANGGRTLDFPIGDLLNPVYSTLNRLTGSSAFPQLENISEQLLPNNFYDARFRTSLPLLNADLGFQKQVRSKQVQWTKYQIASYRATLIQDIQLAYYNFCAAHTALEIIMSTQALVALNLKDTRSLLENGKGLPAAVLRAESEVEAVQALLIEAKNKKKNAAHYLNFLVNRPLQDEVVFEAPPLNLARMEQLLQEASQEENPELRAMQTLVSIQETVLKSGKNYWIPKLSTYADLGSQSFDWTINAQSRYLIWGLNLNVPVFHGGRNLNQIQKSTLGLQSVQLQKELLGQKLALDLQVKKNEVTSLMASMASAEKKLTSAAAYFRLVDKGFKEGTQSLIEFIDARNQYTQAALQKNISIYSLQMALAQLERLLTTETN